MNYLNSEDAKIVLKYYNQCVIHFDANKFHNMIVKSFEVADTEIFAIGLPHTFEPFGIKRGDISKELTDCKIKNPFAQAVREEKHIYMDLDSLGYDGAEGLLYEVFEHMREEVENEK